jgi:hypothetical protein
MDHDRLFLETVADLNARLDNPKLGVRSRHDSAASPQAALG